MESKKDYVDKRLEKRSHGTYELPEIKEPIPCPVCGGELTFKRTVYQLADGDDIIIVNMECPKCNFRKNDVIPLNSSFQAGEYRLTVDDGNLEHKIFRSPSGDIDIPEIGMAIERGPSANYLLNNVEGILQLMKEQVEHFLIDLPVESEEWKNTIIVNDKLDLAIEGKFPFTLILRDLEGGSYIATDHKEKINFTPIQSSNEN
jgi:zinc finger protein